MNECGQFNRRDEESMAVFLKSTAFPGNDTQWLSRVDFALDRRIEIHHCGAHLKTPCGLMDGLF